MTEKNEELLAKETSSAEKEIVSKQKLLEAGTYFGHKASQWNPKMKPYIHTKKMGTHIIDILKTQKALEFAYKLIQKFASKGASFIFVGTKRQAKKVIEEQALRTNSVFVSERWLGGTLTNSRTIFSRVREMQDLEKLAETNFEGYTKKEGVLKTKELEKLHKNLNGIRNMKQLPQVMIIADPKADIIAVKEARKKGIKVIGIIDTDVDPTLVDFGIPANDDSVKSLTLIITILADAIVTAKNGKAQFAYQEDAKVVLPEDPEKEKK
ncbi:30S ribosomal protein S2 [Mesomycoplasma lagogenitalium]|uniref:Small ribosomal subunit protein uS2 n=1 Tax=Mesomycoplasma lagogenitalium TaxID=171286 RepID=A0ABY8LUR8_9BACT|nr:30S ribosomal protein S2 [Mesomycoplasma lagogenitalium]WGI36979.1 30S ribosomal protein S2 [Mesomycoplasma lagogenitalium]